MPLLPSRTDAPLDVKSVDANSSPMKNSSNNSQPYFNPYDQKLFNEEYKLRNLGGVIGGVGIGGINVERGIEPSWRWERILKRRDPEWSEESKLEFVNEQKIEKLEVKNVSVNAMDIGPAV